jgi:mannose-6-phosphate isomerase-like protein (cupin superfamily)
MGIREAVATGFFRAPGAGPVLDVLGVRHVYKATAAETGGLFSLWEAVIPPGAGAPPHVHEREDEAFYVLSGELEVEREGETRKVGPGGFFFGARGERHAFRNIGTAIARVLVICTPGHGLEQMFRTFNTAAADPAPPALPWITATAADHGVTIMPPG